jgi:phospholipase C
MRALFVLLAAGVAGSIALVHCSSSDGPVTTADAGDQDVDERPPTPAEWDRAVTRPDDQAATQQRASCTFKRGSMPAETLGKGTPVDKDIPIQNIVVIVQENHSFDNYFGRFGKFAGRNDVESAPDNASNPGVTNVPDDAGVDGSSSDGGTPVSVPYTHNPHLCTLDTNHEWSGTHQEWNNGAMDGFVKANEGWSEIGLSKTADPALKKGDRAMLFYDERDIPFYYDLAKTFAIADHYHAPVLGPTWPNRMYVYAATSFGETTNSFPDISAYPYPAQDATVLDELEKRHVDWELYTDGTPSAGIVYNVAGASRWNSRHINAAMSEFMTRAAAGTLPSVAFVDAVTTAEGPEGNDEHPPGQIQIGQKFVSDVVHALMKSPQWAHTALFITWDEHGGYYDHLPPPAACPPDDKQPKLEPGDTTKGGFDHYGVRVPLIVVSPYAKKGYVGHTTYDHTSITRFIEAKFKIPALSNRDANADPLMDLFDFGTPAFATPPTIAEPAINQSEVDYCKANFGK